MLDALMDGAGNSVTLAQNLAAMRKGPQNQNASNGHINSKTTRSLSVLRRASMSFKGCGHGHPASLLIGAEAPLLISTNEADPQDGPWDVTLKYQPPSTDQKKYKPWKKTISTEGAKRELTVRASAPGEYSIVDVKGRFCPGDILSPDLCRVMEQPYPTAEIEWKRIHEWYATHIVQ